MAIGATLVRAIFLLTVSAGCRDTTPDSAAAWGRRADSVPELASWMALRAAALTPDSMARRVWYVRVTLPAARERIPWVEARARERYGDTVGALRWYQGLGARVTTFRLRGELARGAGDSAQLRRDLLRYIASSPGAGGVRDGYALFDALYDHATPDEQLTIARAAAAVGAWSRARAGFEAALGRTPTSPRDQFLYATALARLGESDRALSAFSAITRPVSLAAAAQYQRARIALAMDDRRRALAQLRMLVKRAPRDTSAALAQLLLADLASDETDDRDARRLLLAVARTFPRSRFALSARRDAGFAALALGDARAAASDFAALQRLATTDDDARLQALYWLGRARARQGRGADARAAWREVVRRDSTSYYAVLAAQRLGTRAVHAAHDTTPFPNVPAVDSALRRIDQLHALQMEREVDAESDYLFHTAGTDRNRLLATGAAFIGTDRSRWAIVLGRRALSDVGPTTAAYRLIYPLAVRDTIVQTSHEYGVDPALVAALIRQESNFNPRALSPAGARGLMQLMPSVAQFIAERSGITPWSPSLLYHPGVNVRLGVAHLAPLLRAQPDVAYALAAYNAGETRVARWGRKRGAGDPELFTERIPFDETRDYVKSILRGRELYRALYDWTP